MIKYLVILAFSAWASSSFAAGAYLTSIKSFKNGSFRGESKLVTSTAIAESRQGDAINFISNSVQFLPDASSESMIFKLKIKEQWDKASFSLDKSFKISKAGAITSLNHVENGDTYRYEVTVTPQ